VLKRPERNERKKNKRKKRKNASDVLDTKTRTGPFSDYSIVRKAMLGNLGDTAYTS